MSKKSLSDIFEAAKLAGKIKKMVPRHIKFSDVGDSFLGRFQATTIIEGGEDKPSYPLYLFDSDEGVVSITLGAMINSKKDFFTAGKIYFIEYLGKEKTSKGNQINIFNIEEIEEVEE